MSERFFNAVVAGDRQALQEALEREPLWLFATAPASFDDQGGPGASALHLAAYHGHEAIERDLIEAGLAADTLNAEGRSALHVALEYNNDTRDALLELGCPVDVCAASALQNMRRLDELLEAQPRLANDASTGLSPLGWAAFFGAEGSLERLLEAGALQLDEPIFCAAQVGHVGAARLLVEHGADPARISEDAGGNVLHVAVLMRHASDARPFVQWLLDECHVDPGLQSHTGQTARQLAEREDERQRAAGCGPKHDEWRPFRELAKLLAQAEERWLQG